jgi:haloalkane dehalogenase
MSGSPGGNMRSQARFAVLYAMEAGHWPQIDTSGEVARIMLAAN